MKSIDKIKKAGVNHVQKQAEKHKAYKAMLDEEKPVKPKKNSRPAKKKVYKKLSISDLSLLELFSKQKNIPLNELKKIFTKVGSVNKVVDAVIKQEK